MNLNTIYLNATEPPVCSKDENGGRTVFENVFDGVSKSDCYLYIPTGTINDYEVAAGWRSFANIAEFDPTGICDAILNSHSKEVFYSLTDPLAELN